MVRTQKVLARRALSNCGESLVASLTNSTVSATWESWRFHQAIDLNGWAGTDLASTVFESTTNIVCAFDGRMVMQTKSRSRITTRRTSRRLPAKRPPTHPGEMLLEEFLKPLGIGPAAFAARLGISSASLNEIIRAKRSVTPETALRLAQVLGISADFWLGLQQDWDLWHAARSKDAEQIAQLEPLRRVG